MGNKSLVSPFPNYDSAVSHLNATELTHIKSQFRLLSQNHEVISYEQFMQIHSLNGEYLRKHILPRLFATFDSKKDGVLDFEEYVRAIALFRLGTMDDKITFLYFMYDGSKNGGSLTRDNLRHLLVDATISMQKEEIDFNTLESWVADLHLLSEAMAETALLQFGIHSAGKLLDIQEFIAFAKTEGTVHGMLKLIPTLIGN